MAASICVRFRLGRLDIAAWVVHFAMRYWLYWGLSAAAAAFLAWREATLHRGEPHAATSALAGAALIFVAMWTAMVLMTLALTITRRSRLVGSELVVEASEDGIRLEHVDGASEVRWTGIRRVSTGPRHLFLHLAANQAVVIPRRAVMDQTAWAALTGFCRRRAGGPR